MKQHIRGGMPDSLDVEALKKEVEELRQRNGDLESQVAQLQAEVCNIACVVTIFNPFYMQLAKFTEESEVSWY